jgi:hypothetical protein
MKLPSIPFRGKIQGGRIQLEQREQFAALIQRLDGQDVEVILRKLRKQRSLNQNSYFHGVVLPLISEHTGYETEEVKEILKQMFLLVDDGKYPHCRHTSSLDTAEMAEFTERCRRWAAIELGVAIPDPGEAG